MEKDGTIYHLAIVGQTSGIKDQLRDDITANRESYLGKVMVIKAVTRFPSGFFRHPQFKCLRVEGDKAPEECIWEIEE
jgi:hypothetical protein